MDCPKDFMENIIIASAVGNVTAFVLTPTEKSEYSGVALQIMRENPSVEQVAFVKEPICGADGRIELMGGEFCCNAVRSFACILAGEKKQVKGEYLIECSGVSEPVKAGVLPSGEAYAELPLPQSIGELDGTPLVKMEGISHLIFNRAADKSICDGLRETAKRLNAEALGAMFITDGGVTPVVYVRDTDSTVFEGSCGSGAAAIAAFNYSISGGKRLRNDLNFPRGVIKTEVLPEGAQSPSVRITSEIEFI